jgi:hypothetical protein
MVCLGRVVLVGIAAAGALGSCGGSGGGGSAPPGVVITSEADSILHLDQLRTAGFTVRTYGLV